MVDGVGPELGFESEGAAVADGTSLLSGIAAVEEVAAVELDAALVGVDFHLPAGLGLIQAGDPAEASSGR